MEKILHGKPCGRFLQTNNQGCDLRRPNGCISVILSNTDGHTNQIILRIITLHNNPSFDCCQLLVDVNLYALCILTLSSNLTSVNSLYSHGKRCTYIKYSATLLILFP